MAYKASAKIGIEKYSVWNEKKAVQIGFTKDLLWTLWQHEQTVGVGHATFISSLLFDFAYNFNADLFSEVTICQWCKCM